VPSRAHGLGVAHPLLCAAGLFVAVRMLVVAWVTARHGWDEGLVRLGLSWDGGFYREIVEGGYPAGAVSGEPPWRPAAKRLAFFPLHPLVTAGIAALLGLSTHAALVLSSLVAGAAGAALVVAIGRAVRPDLPPLLVGALWACWPGGWSLSLGYSEGLFVALCAGSLLALLRDRYLLSALLAAAATTARAVGVVLVAVVVVEVALRLRRTGASWVPTWLALSAVAASGGAALLTWSTITQGRPDAWLAVEHEYWGKQVDLGARNALALGRAVLSPTDHPQVLLSALLLAVVALGLWRWLRDGAPRPLRLYAIGVFLVPLVTSATLISGARFALPAFPFVLGLAALLLGRRRLLAAALLVGVAVLVAMVDLASGAGVPELGPVDSRWVP
jgi:hypothetical protein